MSTEPTTGSMQSRRSFLKGAAVAGAATAVAGTACIDTALADIDLMSGTNQGITYTRSTCSPNCTGACGMVAAVKDGKICTMIQAADYSETEYNPRGCLKGTTRNTELYGDDRLTYPMVRDRMT